MAAITESNRAQLEQFISISIGFLDIYYGGMFTIKRINTAKKEVSGFPIYTYILVCQPEKG